MKLTPKDKALRDQIAVQVMCICMADTSRQLATGHMPLDDAQKAINAIARLSYAAADAMLRERVRK